MKTFSLVSAMVLFALWSSGLAAGPASEMYGAEAQAPSGDQPKGAGSGAGDRPGEGQGERYCKGLEEGRTRKTGLRMSRPSPAIRPSLAPVEWIGPAPSLEFLKGKTVIVLVYGTTSDWCNGWSGKLVEQLKAAIAGKPVVVLAINTDLSQAFHQEAEEGNNAWWNQCD